MQVKIREIIDHGHDDERIILNEIQDTDIGEYLVMDTTYASYVSKFESHKVNF